jgi:hypothetical protein
MIEATYFDVIEQAQHDALRVAVQLDRVAALREPGPCCRRRRGSPSS